MDEAPRARLDNCATQIRDAIPCTLLRHQGSHVEHAGSNAGDGPAHGDRCAQRQVKSSAGREAGRV